jgi:N-acylneuraminate cytidylyltransferase
MSTNIKIVFSDVDGVLTDGGMYYSENGDELKRFSVYDGMAFEIARENGLKTGIITAEDRLLNRRRAEKLKLDFHFHGIKRKYEFMIDFCRTEGITLEDIAYVGDDRNDYQLLSKVGLAACPANAIPEIKSIPNIRILQTFGGHGVIRELVNDVLELPNL